MATTTILHTVTVPQAAHSYIAVQSPAPSTSTEHVALKTVFTSDFDVEAFMLLSGSTHDATFTTSAPTRLSWQQTESLSGDVLRLGKELYEVPLELVKEELSLVRKASQDGRIQSFFESYRTPSLFKLILAPRACNKHLICIVII